MGIVHEGFLLPLVMAISLREAAMTETTWAQWLEAPMAEASWEQHIHFMLIGYLVADMSNYPFSPGFSSSLLAHHVLSSSLAVAGLCSGRGAGYAAVCIVVPEFGSLWLNLCDMFPSRLMYLLRFGFYTSSRIVSAAAGVRYICINDVLWTRVVTSILMVGVLGNNAQVISCVHLRRLLLFICRTSKLTLVPYLIPGVPRHVEEPGQERARAAPDRPTKG